MSTETQTTLRTPLAGIRSLVLAALTACLLLLAVQANVAAAKGPFGFQVDGETNADAAGAPAVLAGSHPYESNAYLKFDWTMERRPIGTEDTEVPNGQVKDLETILPPGMVGTALATPTCDRPDFSNPIANAPLDCADNTAVGWAKVLSNFFFHPDFKYLYAPVYNLDPSPGEPALFGFRISTATIYLHPKVRSGKDAGISLVASESSQALELLEAQVNLWGTPGDDSHDNQRGRCTERDGWTGPFRPAGLTCPATGLVPKPMISYPTACSGPLTTTVRSNSWGEPQNWVEHSFLSHGADGVPAGVERCEDLPFEPRVDFVMEPSTAASPGSLDVTMSVPQNDSPDARVSAHVKKVVATLPEGVTLNTSSADGLGVCTLEQINIEGDGPSSCPESSRIGTVRVNTPLLADELGGSLFLAEQNRNPFNSLIAMYLAIEDEKNGVYLKTPGRVDLDPETGRLTTVFDEQPQFPFNELEISFAGGPRAALATPSACGTYSTNYELTSWSGKVVPGKSSVNISRNCGRDSQFGPGFEAGTTDPTGGGFSPFKMRITREDGQQNIAAIGVSMPEGLSAKLAGVPLCGDAGAGSGNCPAASQIGTTTVASGVGTNPVFVPQPGKAPTALYLAGPYKGAPYSLVAKVPAQAGPFDLGTVSVRSAIHVDPATAKVTVNSDPLPQILQGVPVRYRDIRVEVDRPEFTLNPTDCRTMAVAGNLTSDRGTTANRSARFRATDCAKLNFKPRLQLSLKGGTKRSQFPALKAVLTTPKGANANIATTSVALPRSEFLEQSHIRTVCTRVQYRADNCPSAAIYGYAEARTPLLDEPLRGPVYLRSSDELLPNLVAALKGPIEIDLVGSIDSIRGGIRTTFKAVPDAPVSRFVLQMQGGKKGLLVNSRNVCGSAYRATVKMDGQNNKAHDFRPVLRHTGCKKKR
jgi:hypothetical protein